MVMLGTSDDLVALHRAADEGELELLYQPEVELATGRIVAMEGLLRWHHRDLGLLGPPSFLPLAEASGEINPIGEWVLRTGAADVAGWARQSALPRPLWLNVSAAQLGVEGFAEVVGEVVAEYALPHGALGIELTEAGLGELGDRALAMLSRLREHGVALAVDDVSGAPATLGALETLPVDAVKLSRRCVRGVAAGSSDDGDGADDRLVARIIEVAHRRGVYVVAEGVETGAQAARLAELGCDRAYGWLFCSAQRADKAAWLLRRGQGWMGTPVSAPGPVP